MNEFPTILKAREFLRDAGSPSVPVDIKRLAAAANAKIRVAYDLADDESGQTTPFKDKHIIIVNGNHREERQRFTVLHEIAHIVLGLPSQHHGSILKTEVLLRYARRPEEEVLCDVFAAECLLPCHPFASQVAGTDISLDAVKSFAQEYKASLTTTGSRFALNANETLRLRSHRGRPDPLCVPIEISERDEGLDQLQRPCTERQRCSALAAG